MILGLPWLVLFAAPLHAQIDARMMGQPDVSQTRTAFVYAGDVWIVPKIGGLAQRLSSPEGEESRVREPFTDQESA
jgi:tricorn protease